MKRWLCAMIAAALPVASALAQDELCDDPSAFCGAKLRPECLSRVGAGSIAATSGAAAPTGACSDQLDAYSACLAKVATDCGGASTRPGGACEPSEAQAIFLSAERANDCIGYTAFLEACPDSRQAILAQAALRRLSCTVDEDPEDPGSGERTLSNGDGESNGSVADILIAPTSGGCLPAPDALTRPIQVKVGSRICRQSDPAATIRIVSIQSRGLRYRNGPQGALTCLAGETCAFYWSARSAFRVVTAGQPPGVALLSPLNAR